MSYWRTCGIKEYQQKFSSYVISCFAFQWTKDVKLTVMHNSPNNSYSVSACPQIHLTTLVDIFHSSLSCFRPASFFNVSLASNTNIGMFAYLLQITLYGYISKTVQDRQMVSIKVCYRIMRSIEWWQCPSAHAMDIAWAVGHCHAMS